jgi:hypothetical protein
VVVIVRIGAEADDVAGPVDAVEGLLGARRIVKASSSVSFRKRQKGRTKEENNVFIVIVVVVVADRV